MAKQNPAADLRAKTDAELRELEKSTANELFQARFENHTNRLNNTSRIPKLRAELARLKTLLTQRRKGAAAAK